MKYAQSGPFYGVDLSTNAVKWLVSGERGASSEFMFALLNGVKTGDEYPDFPLDTHDFRRCELLLREVPNLRPKFTRMRRAGPQWKALVDGWQDVCDLLDTESPGWHERGVSITAKCPMASALIRKLTQATK
jgi:hypothetical protein